VQSYDQYLGEIRDFVADVRSHGKQVREFCVESTRPETLMNEIPVQVGPGAQRGIILRNDVYAELGNPSAGSSAFVMWTTDTSAVSNGRVTLVGPDIQEIEEEKVPFGQVLIVGGKDLSSDHQPALEQRQYVSSLVEGYMVKSSPGRVWSRVSKDSVAKGFNFEVLGKALMAVLRTEFPVIESVEVLFVTSSKDEIRQLEKTAEQVRVLGKAFRRDAWRAKGFDLVDCTMGTDCASCEEAPACDDIRDVAKLRKKRTRNEDRWASLKKNRGNP